jgi:hypothetical protein
VTAITSALTAQWAPAAATALGNANANPEREGDRAHRRRRASDGSKYTIVDLRTGALKPPSCDASRWTLFYYARQLIAAETRFARNGAELAPSSRGSPPIDRVSLRAPVATSSSRAARGCHRGPDLGGLVLLFLRLPPSREGALRRPRECWWRRLRIPEARNGSMKTLVVGAGLSGLVAAYRLQAVGHEVTILEARPRVGGRVLTLREPFAEGQHADVGAMILYEGQNAILSLCREFGIELTPLKTVGAELPRVKLKGRLLNAEEIGACFGELGKAQSARPA